MTVPVSLMGLPGMEQPKLIPQCELIVRRGEIPDMAGYSNVWNWTPELAKRPLEFEPVVKSKKPPKDGDPATENMRRIVITDTLNKLLPEDFAANGIPKISVMREKSGMADLTQEEVHAVWKEWKT